MVRMTLEQLYERERVRLTRRLERLVGSREIAEDLVQEAFIRVWRSAPEELPMRDHTRLLNRTASNLAIDELRRRRRRPTVDLDSIELGATGADLDDDVLAVREALRRLTPHERMVLLLRFEAGLSHSEIGALIDRSADAARKRVERARRTLARVLHGVRVGRRPVVLLEARGERDAFRDWLEAAGAKVRMARITNRELEAGDLERELALADAVVIAGSVGDLHPGIYRERPRTPLDDPDPELDIRELRLLNAALRLDIPVLGACRGHQLLNIALGGTLYQDLGGDGATRRPHRGHAHRIETVAGTRMRSLLGRRPEVASEHHQASRHLGRGLRVSAVAEDGVVETAELPHRRFALGLQWCPLRPGSGDASRRIAEALVEAATP
jgi:RNA polymerase sigma factor (sigma-70 family)